MDWTEDYTDPLEEIRRAQEADRGATNKAQMLADLQRNADMIISRRLQARQKASPIDDNLKAFVLSKKLEGDEASRDLAARKLERTNIEDGPAPAEWGAPVGLTRSEALRAGYAKAPKALGDPEEMAPKDWYDRLSAMGIAHPEQMYRKEAMRLLAADVGRQGQVEAAVGAEDRRSARERPEKDVKVANDLRKEFQTLPNVKATMDMADAIEKIRGVPENGTGDLSLIYSYVKMLDPGSVVREGEIALSREPTPLLTKLVAQFKKVKDGDLLAPELRTAYKEASESLWASQLDNYNRSAEQYRSLAGQLGVDPGTVVLDYGYKANRPRSSTAAKPRRKFTRDASGNLVEVK